MDNAEFTVGAPTLISVGTESIVERAQALGLTWDMRPGTVSLGSRALDSFVQVTYDGDINGVNSVNLTGVDLVIGDRVMAIWTPPSGRFVIGRLAPTLNLAQGAFNTTSMTPGTTTSATFVNLPGSPSITITKRSADTELEIFIAGTWYSTGAMAGLDIGAQVGTTDVAITGMRVANSALTSHQTYAGAIRVANIASGTQVITGRWRRESGAGTLNTDSGDVFSMTVREVVV